MAKLRFITWGEKVSLTKKFVADFISAMKRNLVELVEFTNSYRTGGRKLVRNNINSVFSLIKQTFDQGNIGVSLLVDLLKSPELKPMIQSWVNSTREGIQELTPVILEISKELKPLFEEFGRLGEDIEPSRMVFNVDFDKMVKKFGIEKTAERLVRVEGLQDKWEEISREIMKLKNKRDCISLDGIDVQKIQLGLIERTALNEKIEVLVKDQLLIWKEAYELPIYVK